jgi:hypothetical protein
VPCPSGQCQVSCAERNPRRQLAAPPFGNVAHPIDGGKRVSLSEASEFAVGNVTGFTMFDLDGCQVVEFLKELSQRLDRK